jgi:anti-repressor protein
MTTALFTSAEFGAVRVITEDGKPLFAAKDVATALGYSDSDQAIRLHCKAAVTLPVESTGQVRHAKFIPEPDLYRLIMRSKLPSAERFQDWVTEEVLPAIRQTGSFGVPIPQSLPEALRLAADLAEKNEVLALENAELRPKAEFHDIVTASDDVVQLATACQVLGLPFGRNTLFQRLRNKGVLISGGERHNLPRQEHVLLGRFTVKESSYLDDERQVHVRFTTNVTQKGLAWLAKEFGVVRHEMRGVAQ